MALTDGRYRARHTLRIGGTKYLTGDLILGSVFDDDAQVKRYLQNGHIDMQAGSAAEQAGGVAIPVEDEGVEVAAALASLNFIGATVTDQGAGAVDVEFSGGGGGPEWYEQSHIATHNDGNSGFGGLSFGTVRGEDADDTLTSYGAWGGIAGGYMKSSGESAYGNSVDVEATFGGIGFGYVQAQTGAYAELKGVFGSIAHGKAKGIGSNAFAAIGAYEMGFAGGYAKADVAGATASIISGYNCYGAIAHGYSRGRVAGAWAYINAAYQGSIAGGVSDARLANDLSTIQTNGRGSFAWGQAGGFNSDGDSTIETSSSGAMAFGYAKGRGGVGAQIEASGYGSMAFGYVDVTNSPNGYGYINAMADNSIQLGPGYNNNPLSLRVGMGIQIHGVIPGSPKNGDIWQDGAGNVVIRSGGVSVTVA